MPDMMTSVRALDWILLLMILEGFGLTALWIFAKRGVPPRILWVTLAAGAAMLLALRAALAGAGWLWVWIPLLAGLLVHLLDLRLHWQIRDGDPAARARDRLR
jgi:hypothetical protein